MGIYNRQLWYFFPNGELVPTPEEAEKAQEQRAERLAQKLRELGVDPTTRAVTDPAYADPRESPRQNNFSHP
ncbi:MAG: hypothetical protein Q6L60_14860 [Thermostichus sp. HHBFW_bins_43]